MPEMPAPRSDPLVTQNNHWITPDNTLTSTITFDLGDTYDLSQIEVLNTSNTNWNDRETDTFTIATSTDGGGTYSDPSDPIALQDYTEGFQLVPFEATGVTHVQLTVTNDPLLGTDTGTADVAVGLNEVKFYSAIPLDSDNDDMPDNWEILHFGDLSRDGSEDEDTDGPDGLTNLEEFQNNTDPFDADSDDDTLTDGDEVKVHNSKPLDNDSDDDLLLDGDEVNLHGTSPILVDTDNDELGDWDEVNTYPTNPALADTDSDNISDGIEILHLGTDPLVPDLRPGLVVPSTINVTATNEFDGNFSAGNLVDDKTLEGFQGTGDLGPPERPANHQNNHWITADTNLTASVTFDLGGSYDLTRIEVLNTSNTNWNDRETDTLTIETSSDGGENYGAPSAPVTIQDYTAGFQTIPVSAPGTTHVRLNVENDPALGTDSGTADVAVGLNEVRFYTGNISSLGTQITSVTYLPGSTEASITWNSTPGTSYLVEFSNDLIQWDEAPDGESVPASAGEETSFTIEYDPAIPVETRFFRVTRLP